MKDTIKDRAARELGWAGYHQYEDDYRPSEEMTAFLDKCIKLAVEEERERIKDRIAEYEKSYNDYSIATDTVRCYVDNEPPLTPEK